MWVHRDRPLPPVSRPAARVATLSAQNAKAFNQLLTWDTSGVTDMMYMFNVRPAAPPQSFAPPPPGSPHRTVSPLSACDLRQYASAFDQPLSWDISSVGATRMRFMLSGTSLSAPNKLLIRCAWEGSAAAASAGYDSSWAPGSCS